MRLFRHAGPDPASGRRPDESREPSQILDPGFHREPWIPAFAGMTDSLEFQTSYEIIKSTSTISDEEMRGKL